MKHLEVEPTHVEHSIPGAYGFMVRGEGGPIAYTGDFRMHGPRKDMSGELMEKAARERPAALICEGTRMSAKPEENHNYEKEEEVGERARALTEGAKGLVLASFSMSNVDRFMSFYNAAREAGRKMVIGTELAHILHTMREKIPVIPDVASDPHIRVYYRLSRSCTFCEKDYKPRENVFRGNMVTYKDIRKGPGEYLMHLGFYRLMELAYLRPEKATFIYSMSEHFYEGEDNEEQRTVWENWMRHFGIGFEKAHCSGHASMKDLKEFIRKVKPDVLIPVHTLDAEGFRDFHSDVRMPEKGKAMKI